MEAASSETLKQQFQQLQQQQAKKLERRKQLQEEKGKSKNKQKEPTVSAAFGVDDDLDLKLADPPKSGGYLTDELVDHLNNQIRELKDENGRLYKLLSERDFEIRQLKKKKDIDKASATAGVTNETAATKIVELSKKMRELTAELESEKTKGKQLSKKCQDVQNQLLNIQISEENKSGKKFSSASTLRSYISEDQASVDGTDIKTFQEKLKQAEVKVTDFRNQSQALKQELKLAHKVLSQEVGENVNIQSLLGGTSNWRGRAQQVLTLQKRVSELKGRLESQQSEDVDLEEEMMGGSWTFRKPTADERQRNQLRKLEKEKKEAQERSAAEVRALEEDHASLKQKLDASKARNKVLSNEVKFLKQQMQTLLDKGHHDDELINALMQQLQQLKQLMDNSNKSDRVKTDKQQEKLKELSMKTQQDNNIVEQLKAIVSEKEAKVRALEDEIGQLKLNHQQKNQLESVGALFSHCPLPAGSLPPTASGGDNLAIRSITPPQSRHGERTTSSMSVASQHGPNNTRVSSRKSNRPPSSSSTVVDRQMVEELQGECREYKTLAQVSAVERDKLAELIQVLQKRLEESGQKLGDSQNELIQQRRRTVKLEKELGKANIKLDQNNSSRPAGKKKTGSKTNISINNLEELDIFDDGNIEELQISLSIQKDENEALKAALQSTLKAKEEDLKMYTEMMEETKMVFLQALRQCKQTS